MASEFFTADWMNYGRVAAIGDTKSVLAQYHSEIAKV